MAYDIGTARGVIELDYNGRGVDQAKEDLEGVKQAGMGTQEAFSKTARGAAIAGAAIAGGLALGVNAAMDFEHRLSAISAVSGATASEMDKVRDKALQLGKDTAFSAGESAQAMEELIKAGLSVEDVLNGAADATVNLAAAGEVDMVTAATIASNAMNQFGLGAKDMVGVVDQIAGAANASAIDVNDFGMSLSQVGAVANLVGVSFDDTATAIALMGNAGIKGSDAGTSLKTMLNNLQPTTEKQIQLFKDLGIVTEDGSNRFYTAQGNLKSFSQVAGVLGQSLQGMSKQQKQAALETMFGSDAIRAAAVIADNGSKGFDKMAESMNKVSAADVAKERMDNLKGTIEELKGSLETAGIAVGSVLIPALQQIAEALTSAANWFLGLSDAQQKWVTIAAATVASVLLIVAAIIKVVQFIQAFKAALIAIRAVMATTWIAALGPIALVIAAVAAIVAIIILLWNKSDAFRNAVIATWNAIKAAASAVADWFMGTIVPSLKQAWDDIVSAFQAVVGAFQAVWDAIVAVFQFAWNLIVTVVRTYINIVKTVITTALNVLKAIWGAIWGTFGGIIKAVFGLIVQILRLYWTIIKGVILVALNLIKSYWISVWNGIKTFFRAVWAAISAVVRTYIAIVKAIITAAWNIIKSVTSSVWNAIKGVITSVWGAIRGVVMGAVNAVKGVITAAWNAVKSATTSAWNAVKTAISNAIDGIISLVSGIQGRVLGAIGDTASWLFQKGVDIVQGLINGIESMIDNVSGAIGKVTGTIGKFLPGSPVKEGPLKVLNRGHAGKEIVNMVIDGITAQVPEVNAAMDTALGSGLALAAPTAPAGTQARVRARRNQGSRGLRLLEGRLTLDESGKAFIRGIALDEDGDEDDFDDTIRRMG